jgi:hypothetical protein
MMLDLIAMLFVIVLSFILCMKDNNFTCQMSHIVIGLSVVVFYKLAKVLKLNTSTKEHFATTSSLNDFISNNIVGNVVMTPNQVQSLSASDLVAYNNKLTDLINSINDLKNQQVNPPPSVAASPDNIQKLDLESQQQYQMFQIDYLNKQLQNAKDILNSQSVINNNSNYKPIKVYSSCVISNADGSTTIDKPVATGSNASSPSSLQSISGVLSGAQNPLSASGGSRTGTMRPISSSNNFVNLSQSTGAFNDFFKKLSDGQGNININL